MHVHSANNIEAMRCGSEIMHSRPGTFLMIVIQATFQDIDKQMTQEYAHVRLLAYAGHGAKNFGICRPTQ